LEDYYPTLSLPLDVTGHINQLDTADGGELVFSAISEIACMKGFDIETQD
jgi:hypothetical protein